MNEVDLAAFSIERRAVCLTLFRQLNIEDVLIRQLPTDESKAVDAVIGFLNQALEQNNVAHFAFAMSSETSSERHRRVLFTAIQIVRGRGIPLVEIPGVDLFTAYGYPPLNRREQLRRIGRLIWPTINNRQSAHAAVDAALLGLHVQVERMFQLSEAQP